MNSTKKAQSFAFKSGFVLGALVGLIALNTLSRVSRASGPSQGTLLLQGVVPPSMSMSLVASSRSIPIAPTESGGSGVEVGRVFLATNTGESYAIFVSSENGGALAGAGAEPSPYTLSCDSREVSGLEAGEWSRAYLHGPGSPARAEHAFQVKVDPKRAANGSKNGAGRAPAASSSRPSDTLTVSILSF